MISVDIHLVCEVDRDHLAAEEAGGGRTVGGVRLGDDSGGPGPGPAHPHTPALDKRRGQRPLYIVHCAYLDDHRSHGSNQAPGGRKTAETSTRRRGEGERKTVGDHD